MLTVKTRVRPDCLCTGAFETLPQSDLPRRLLRIVDDTKVYDQAYKDTFPSNLVSALNELDNVACAVLYYLDGLCVIGSAGGSNVWVFSDDRINAELPVVKHDTGRADVSVWSFDSKKTNRHAIIIIATRYAALDREFAQRSLVSLYNTVSKVHKPTGAIKFSTREGELEEADNTKVYPITRDEKVKSVRMMNPNRAMWSKKDLKPQEQSSVGPDG